MAATAALACLLVVPFEAAPAHALTSPAPVTVKLTQTCSTGNFKGEVELTTTFVPTDKSGNWTTTVDRYRITRLNGQSGGNKANVNLTFMVYRSDVDWWPGARKTADSPDAMIQDGAWHNLGISNTITNVPVPELPHGSVGIAGVVETEIIFDKSGSDPRCTATNWSDWGRGLENIRSYPQSVGYHDPIAYCMALYNGGSCDISKTETKASTVTVELGFSYEGVSGKLSYNWVKSKAVMVRCVSPAMSTGERLTAYPTGTRYTFDTYAYFFGTMVRGRGEAFEVDGSVACQMI